MGIIKSFIDLVYPPRCLFCGCFLKEERTRINGRDLLLCPDCLRHLEPAGSPLCPICGRPFPPRTAPNDRVCEECLRSRPFYEETRGAYLYEGILAEAIHRFKFKGKTHLTEILGPLLGTFTAKCFKDLDAPLVIPVPLHPKRLRERGFNQSLYLARYVAEAISGDLDPFSLRRTRHTPPQIRLQAQARLKNLRGAFKVVNQGAVRGRTVVLVDDVSTTTATLNECARALRRARARKIFGAVLARTPASKP